MFRDIYFHTCIGRPKEREKSHCFLISKLPVGNYSRIAVSFLSWFQAIKAASYGQTGGISRSRSIQDIFRRFIRMCGRIVLSKSRFLDYRLVLFNKPWQIVADARGGCAISSKKSSLRRYITRPLARTSNRIERRYYFP